MNYRTISRRQLLTHAAAGGAALTFAPGILAQSSDWPSQPIKFIVPFAAAGVTDLTMRTVCKFVSDRIGQPIIVENRAGAGGTVGMNAIAKATPNGYTIGATASSTIIATPLTTQVPFEVSEVAFVSLLASVPMVLSVLVSNPANNAQDFLKYIQANRGKLNYGSTAVGHYGHVAMMEMSESQNGGMVHSPYKGEAPLLQDFLSGTLQVAFFAPSTIKSQVEGGKVKLLGVSGMKRLKSLPNVPTMFEQGLTSPVFRMDPGWVGVIAPAKTPAPILARLSNEFVAAMARPELRDQISDFGLEPIGSNAESFAATFRSDLPVWRQLLTKAGLQVHA